MNSVTLSPAVVNTETLETIKMVRAFDRRGEWQVEFILEGGIKVIAPFSASAVKGLERTLSELNGWRVSPSLFTNGFNARRLDGAL